MPITALERFTEKQIIINQVLTFLNKSVFALNHLGAKADLAEAYFQLGLTYQAMGEHNQAEEHKVKALEFFAKMEAPKQILL